MSKRNLFAILIMSLALILTGSAYGQKKNSVQKKPTASKTKKPQTNQWTIQNTTISNVKSPQTSSQPNQKTKVKKPTASPYIQEPNTTEIPNLVKSNSNSSQKTNITKTQTNSNQPNGKTKKPDPFFRPNPAGDGTTEQIKNPQNNKVPTKSSQSNGKTKVKKPLRLQDNTEIDSNEQEAEQQIEESLSGSAPQENGGTIDPKSKRQNPPNNKQKVKPNPKNPQTENFSWGTDWGAGGGTKVKTNKPSGKTKSPSGFVFQKIPPDNLKQNPNSSSQKNQSNQTQTNKQKRPQKNKRP
jgi:hypothetical protein